MIRTLNGKTPRIHPGAFVSEAAYVIGDVEIGEGSSVWPGSVIRGDTGTIVIGRNTCVQDNSVVHSDGPGAVIGDNVVMGHRVVCHAERVGNGVVIGNGAVVNGGETILGDNCLIAAGAVVLENAKVPARTFMVGVPAREKGTVTDEQIARFRANAEHYVERGRMYKDHGGLE